MALEKKKIAIIAAAAVVVIGGATGVILYSKGANKDESSSQSVIINAGDNNKDASAGEKPETDDTLSLAQADKDKLKNTADESSTDSGPDVNETSGSIVGDWTSDDGFYLSVRNASSGLTGEWQAAGDIEYSYSGNIETDNSSFITIHLNYKRVNGESVNITSDSPEDYKLTIVSFGEDEDLGEIILTVKDQDGSEHTLHSYVSLDTPEDPDGDNAADNDSVGEDGGIGEEEAEALSGEEKDIDDAENKRFQDEAEEELDEGEEYVDNGQGDHTAEELEEMFG